MSRVQGWVGKVVSLRNEDRARFERAVIEHQLEALGNFVRHSVSSWDRPDSDPKLMVPIYVDGSTPNFAVAQVLTRDSIIVYVELTCPFEQDDAEWFMLVGIDAVTLVGEVLTCEPKARQKLGSFPADEYNDHRSVVVSTE